MYLIQGLVLCIIISFLIFPVLGADLLRLSRNDLIQLCGPGDGIRLNNALQAR